MISLGDARAIVFDEYSYLTAQAIMHRLHELAVHGEVSEERFQVVAYLKDKEFGQRIRRRRGLVRRERCSRGHLLAGDNLRADQLRRGVRECRICSNARSRAWRRRLKVRRPT